MFETTHITQPGDSGAPVFDDQKRLVGMAFAGGGDRSLIMPIGPVFEALQVKLAVPE